MHERYIYVVDKKTTERIYWRCEIPGYYSGRIISNGEEITSLNKEHCHPPDMVRKDVLKVKETMKENAKISEEITSTIINKCTENISLETSGALPKKESLARTIRRSVIQGLLMRI